jgi:tRNA threonylcarbamoyladenosine biosynthesis protein TsaB
MIFFGNGADKCRIHITHSNAQFLENIVPKASEMIELAERAFINDQFVDTAYFEPFYLKDFVATVPKNKVL